VTQPTIVGSNQNDGIAFVWLHPYGVNATQVRAQTLFLFFCTSFKAAA